jgi:hypothetical protein
MNAQTKIEPPNSNIYTALAAAQSEFGQVTKGATNPAFKSKYANLSDVASVAIPTLNKHGVAVLHYLVGESLSAMRTEFVHGASDTRVHCDIPLLVDRQNMQGMKSATTYAKRIGLESLSGIAPEDDDGNAASSAPPKQAAPQFVSDGEWMEITSLIEATGTDAAKFCAAFGIKSVKALPASAFSKAKAQLERKLAQAGETVDA